MVLDRRDVVAASHLLGSATKSLRPRVQSCYQPMQSANGASGTDAVYGAISLRARYGVSGTDIAYAATSGQR
eukprot:2840979-Rhodomonas_salina.1